MTQDRDPIPAGVKRAVLVEAGHRCAIPTCRQTPTEFAHIVPWADTHDNSFENLIALCPNCLTRYDTKQIDRKAMLMYKHNLGILNYRYTELERRVFIELANGDRGFLMLGAGAEILLANAVLDGILAIEGDYDQIWGATTHTGQRIETFKMLHKVWLTEHGEEFVKRYVDGKDIE